MPSLQKKVIGHDLWIDKQRLAWAECAAKKNFKTKFHFSPKNKTLAQISQAWSKQLFALAYTQSLGILLKNCDDLYDAYGDDATAILDERWPNRPQIDKDQGDPKAKTSKKNVVRYQTQDDKCKSLIKQFVSEVQEAKINAALAKDEQLTLKDFYKLPKQDINNALSNGIDPQQAIDKINAKHQADIEEWKRRVRSADLDRDGDGNLSMWEYTQATREKMYPLFPCGAPNPALNNPIEEVVDLILNNAELLNRGTHKKGRWEVDMQGDLTWDLVQVVRAGYLVHFEQILMMGVAMDLVIGDTNIMLLGSDTMQDIINSKQGEMISCNDMDHLPFNKFYIEFDEPVKIVDKFKAVAMGIQAHHNQQSYTIVYYSDEPGGLWATGIYLPNNPNKAMFGGKTPVKAPPYKECLTVHMCRGGDFKLDQSNQQAGEYVGSQIPSYYEVIVDGVPVTNGKENVTITEELLRITRNVWDFVTCRNIDYEPKKRPTFKTNKRQYKHLQGKEAALPRDYRLIKVDRRENPYEGDGKQTELAHLVKIPGHFRKLIYCKKCNDLHRHDLIGKPCRDCEQVVGPISNINVVKTWVTPHWKGPEDAPIQELVREMRK